MAADLKFAKTHEWVRSEAGGVNTVGISSYAVEALTDLVFMQLPAVGTRVKAGESERIPTARAGSCGSRPTIRRKWMPCSIGEPTSRWWGASPTDWQGREHAYDLVGSGVRWSHQHGCG